jgi:hypothetical protein
MPFAPSMLAALVLAPFVLAPVAASPSLLGKSGRRCNAAEQRGETQSEKRRPSSLLESGGTRGGMFHGVCSFGRRHLSLAPKTWRLDVAFRGKVMAVTRASAKDKGREAASEGAHATFSLAAPVLAKTSLLFCGGSRAPIVKKDRKS